MEKIRVILFLVAVIIILGISSTVEASAQELFGYIYSENLGWISLNCSNTDSCASVDYKVLKNNAGELSGYGYSDIGGWINFNPNFGGVNIDVAGVYGWAFTENSGWLNFNGEKVVSINDLQNNISSAIGAINSWDLSADSSANLLNSICNDFLTAKECDANNN